jgi:hypothetical protein
MVYNGDLYKYLKEELKISEKNIDYRKPPLEVTYEMLKSSMGGTSRDFQLKIKGIEKDPKNMVAQALWSPYAKIMFPPNNFGLYVEKKGIKHMKFGIKITPVEEVVVKPEEVIVKPEEVIVKPEEEEVLLLEEDKKNERLPPFKPKKPKMYKQLTGGKKTKKFIKNNKAGKKGKKTKKNKGYKKGGIKFDKAYQNYMYGEWPILFMKENYPDPNGALRLYNPPGTALYCMQIPNNVYRIKLFQQFAFMMYDLEIDTIIDLHSCGTGLHPTGSYDGSEGCYIFTNEEEKMNKPLYINSERETWEFLKKMSRENINNKNIQFWNDLEGVGVEDFTAGTLNGWFKLSEYPQINDPNRNKLAIHCQSGYGRSGTVALFYLLRDVHRADFDIEKRFLGKGTSLNMFTYLESILEEKSQKREVFDNPSLFYQRLFVSRINYILLAISNYYKKKVFYLYLLPIQHLPAKKTDKSFENFNYEDLEELKRLTKEELFIPVLIDCERINGKEEVEVYLRRNNFLIGEKERVDGEEDEEEEEEDEDEEYEDEEEDDADDYDQEIF